MDADRQVDAWRRQALGLRFFNPGNLRPSAQKWLGEGKPYNGYCTFDTPEHGLRAMAKDLLAKYDKHALVTIRGIISRYAPPSENDTAAYIRFVSQKTGFDPDAWLHLHEPSVLGSMMLAMIRLENGIKDDDEFPYNDEQIAGAVTAALNP